MTTTAASAIRRAGDCIDEHRHDGDDGQMTTRDESPQLMKVAEVAALLRTPLSTVRYWRHIGSGPKSFKIGRSVVYDRADVLAWIDAQRDTRKRDA